MVEVKIDSGSIPERHLARGMVLMGLSRPIDTRRRARIFWHDKTTGADGIYTDPGDCPSMHATGDEDGFSIYWWAEGNGSCKSNREGFFGVESRSEEHECEDDRFTISRLEVIESDGSVIQTFDVSYFAEVGQ